MSVKGIGTGVAFAIAQAAPSRTRRVRTGKLKVAVQRSGENRSVKGSGTGVAFSIAQAAPSRRGGRGQVN